MSYVLDALRRAEADRQRGQVPHLHVSTTLGGSGAAAPAADDPPSRGRPVRLAVLVVMLAGLLAAGTWWWRAQGSQPPADAPMAGSAVAGAADSAPGAVASDSTPPLPLTMVPAVPPGRMPGAATGPVPPPVALPSPVTPARVPVQRTPSATATAAMAAPPMAFGGAFDSPDPKARMLIINGQVWREGDEPAPGWVLERIGLHEARFQVQGRAVDLRYEGITKR